MIINATGESVGETNSECTDNQKFMCGVVEGFYGRPWTSNQRRRLFQRMNKMGMDTYLYAPKDDCKHRIYWRDLYTVEEADHLTSLITAANEENITFVYALSPGLDMTYSSGKEITCLKRKLEQVVSFGCHAFALLFDDIEIDMCESDKEIFQSFAQAQVSVTNEVFQHLGQPGKFLFCPTEYCATRAVPTVAKSEYLNTIGSKLLSGIDIMWTGPKVVSKKISIKSVEELTQVLQRPPVIWDNIHANDYDQRRLFLGPYDGRSSELIPYLRGVMTNPNCEFEANFIAMHTLAQWSKSNAGGMKKDFILSESPVSADIKLETEGQFTTDEDIPVNSMSYQPKLALCDAIKDWREIFYQTCSAESQKFVLLPINAPVGDVNASTNLNSSLLVLNDSYMQPTTVNPVNSLVDLPVSSDGEDDHEIVVEPMDCGSSVSGASTCSSTLTDGVDAVLPLDNESNCHCPLKSANAIETMQIDIEMNNSMLDKALLNSENSPLSPVPNFIPSCSTMCSADVQLSEREVQDIIEMFYTPFEHGTCGTGLLNEFHWLKISAKDVSSDLRESSPAGEEWHQRAREFSQRIEEIDTVFNKFCSIPNKALLYDLFPYIWDMAVVLNQLQTFTGWLALGRVAPCGVNILQGSPYSWSNVIFREHFSCGEQEPWVFRGGLQAEFQRMLPLEGAADLLVMTCPSLPFLKLGKIRPYTSQDKAAVYEVCRRTCDDGLDGTEIFPEQPDLIGDKLVGAFVSTSPEYCFVVEDDQGVYGYVLAAINAADHAEKISSVWIPAMQEKYPKPVRDDHLTPAEEIIAGFHNPPALVPPSLYTAHPAVVRMDIIPDRIQDATIAKRAMASMIATLKVSVIHGIYTEIHVGDQNMAHSFTKLGFIEVPLPDTPEDLMYMGRMI